jgi:hypothetical protein
MTDEAFFDKMDDYLLGKLPPEEAKAFESELSRRPGWQEEFELRRIEHEGMELLLEDKLRAEMRQWDKSPARRKGFLKYGIWLVPLLFLAGGVVVFWNNPAPENALPAPQNTSLDSLEKPLQQIDNQPATAPVQNPPVAQKPLARQSPATDLQAYASDAIGDLDVSFGVRGDDNPSTQALADSLDAALLKKDYARLLTLAETAPEEAGHGDELRYIKGWALFKLRRFSEAEDLFARLMAGHHHRLQVKAQRMLLYTFLAQQPARRKALENRLQEILKTEGHPLKNEAEAISTQLKQ